jgi:para-nitrobenzyl esterase
MRRVLLGVVLPLLLVAAACDPLATPPGASPLRYRDLVFTGATRTSAIVYGHAVDQSGTNVTLLLDMWQPTGDTVTQRPAIIWVHGGSFRTGLGRTSAEIVDEATTFAQKGYVTVSIDYRTHPVGCTQVNTACLTAIVQAREDAQTAVRFLRENAAAYGIDPGRIAIGGSSAGAITALNVGYSPENPGPGEHQGPSSAVGAVQSISGAALLSEPANAGDAPALMFHCTTDPLVSFAWAQTTVTNAQNAGLLVVLRTWDATCHVPYADHRDQILNETTNFFYWRLDLGHAAR